MTTRLNRFCPPLLPLVIALAAGILAGLQPSYTPAWFVLAGGLIFFPCFIFFCFRPAIGFALLCITASIWGYVSMARMNAQPLPDTHISNFTDGSGRVISGRIVSLARHYPGKAVVRVACCRVEAPPGLNTAVGGRIRLNIYDDGKKDKASLPVFGDEVKFYAVVHPIRNFANPGGYDYEAQMRYQGVWGTAHVRERKLKIISPKVMSFSTRFFREVESIRTRFWHQVTDLGNIASEDRAKAAAILTALVTGKKEVVPRKVRDDFSRAGLSHLLAISGFHLSLVAVGFYFVFKQILGRFYLLTLTGRARKIAGMMTLIPVAGYALFTGFSPSTQRALIMVVVFMAAVCWEREKDPFNVLCLAAILILVMDPSALFSISFQLSFTAVFFIIFGLTRVYKLGWMPENPIAAWGAGMVWVSLFAGLGTVPLIARYFNLVSFVQVFANLMMVPVMGLVCLPLGFAGLLLAGFHSVSGFWVLDRVLDILVLCIRFISCITEWKFAWIRVVTPGGLDLVLIYLFMGTVYLAAITHKRAVFVFLGLVIAAEFLSIAGQLKERFFPGRLVVTVLDVGQGNAAVARTPEGHVLLIDGGGFSGGGGFDTGRFLVAPFLWRHWIQTLDAVILTHPQGDHMDGLIFVAENFRIRRWIQNTDKNNTQAFAILRDQVVEKNIPNYFPADQGLAFDFGSVRLRVLPDALGPPGDLNNNSLVSRLSLGGFAMLFPGDIKAGREMRLARNPENSLKSQVLLAPHHGSRSSSSKIFLDKVRPQGVIISCGYNNRYGFPHPEILERYRTLGMTVFRTDIQGAVTVTSSGNGYDIKPHRNE